MDGNAKSDLEHSTEKAVRISTKGGGIIAKITSKYLIMLNKYIEKRFSPSMKTLKKDGSTKELTVSPALTKEETKEIIAKARECGVLLGVKKMQPDGEVGTNKSLHQQERMAKNEINFNRWNERRKTLKKIPVLNKFSGLIATKYKRLSQEDNARSKDDRYVVICNKSHLSFLSEQLDILSKKRLQKASANELEDINKDGEIDKVDYAPLVSRDINITPDKLNVLDEDYGSCMVSDYHSNFCLQRITKSEYCEIREELFELKSHGAKVIGEDEVLIAINSDDLEEYKRFAPLDKPIKEFGVSGGKDIEAEKNINNIIPVQIENEKDFSHFKSKYKEKDYIAQHTPDGKVLAYVKEEDTKNMVNDIKKKSSTADLLKEANEFENEKHEIIDENEITIDNEEELEIGS